MEYIWTPNTIMQHRGHEVVSRNGHSARLGTDFRGMWFIGLTDNLDIWQVCLILNQQGATPLGEAAPAPVCEMCGGTGCAACA